MFKTLLLKLCIYIYIYIERERERERRHIVLKYFLLCNMENLVEIVVALLHRMHKKQREPLTVLFFIFLFFYVICRK